MTCFSVSAGLALALNLCPAPWISAAAPSPHTDPVNAGGWVLNASVSDEFNRDGLDAAKWHAQGTDGHYNNNFVGRAPSQFVPRNIEVKDGHLEVVTRWEPDFAFSDKKQHGLAYENITTGAAITKAEFRYGYMEIRCRAADGPISSAFWAIGSSGELDVFEHWGRNADKPSADRRYHTSFHDWRDPNSPTWSQRIWTNDHLMEFRVADGFHVYGLEWDPDYIRIYVDGRLIRHETREEIGDAWVANGDMKVWLDSEIFPWEMDPAKITADSYPADGARFTVDYVRVWQRDTDTPNPTAEPLPTNLIDNPQFERGVRGWKTQGDAKPARDGGHQGHGVRLGARGSLTQTVALKPDTTYVLSAWARMPGTVAPSRWENAFLTVDGYGGDAIERTFFRNEWGRVSLEFTTGADRRSAEIEFTNQKTGHEAVVDHFELFESTDRRR